MIPRIAAVGGYMAYFEGVMGPMARDQRRAHLRAVLAPLAGMAEIADLGLLADPAEAPALAATLRAAPPDVLLVIPTMATPPGAIAELAAAAGAPVVVACAHDLHAIGPEYDMAALCRHSTQVGATMVESLLRRQGRPSVTVVGDLGDPGFHTRLAMAIRAAALVHRFRGLRLGRLGAPMPGYDHVGLTAEEAGASGLALVDIPLARWAGMVAAVTPARIAGFLAADLPALVPAGTAIGQGPDWDRAVRLALALQDLIAAEDLAGGSLTCRGPFGLGLPDGAIGCLATSLATSAGRPFSATGDLAVAVAMILGRGLGGATLYCELDAIDRGHDRFLVANTGEGDFAWVPPGGRCDIRPAGAHSGTAVAGLVLDHDLTPGPATMLGAGLDRSRAPRLTLSAMEGEVPADPARTGLRVTHGWLATHARPAARAAEAWIATGATHHGALSRGHLAEGLRWFGRLAQFPTEIIA